MSDKLGGARVTLFTFVGMIAAVLGVMMFMPVNGQGGDFNGFLAMFIVLFALTGVGNGSTFRMIPVIFLREAYPGRRGPGRGRAQAGAGRGRQGIGGGAGLLRRDRRLWRLLHPAQLRHLAGADRRRAAALYCFIAFYATCVLITWWQYAPQRAGAVLSNDRGD